MRDSTYSLYTFRGVKPRAQWDPRVLDDLEGDIESKDVGEVSIVARDAVSAKKRCEEGRWVRLRHTATRALLPGELSAQARGTIVGDAAFDQAWVPLIDAIEQASGDYAIGSWVHITFLSEKHRFHPSGSPFLSVKVLNGGHGYLQVGGDNTHSYLPGAAETLVPQGWVEPIYNYQLGFASKLPPGFTLTQAFHRGLSALTSAMEYSSDDYLLITGQAAGAMSFLDVFHPTPKGQLIYHHLPVTEEVGAALQARMRPFAGYYSPKLTTEAREAFLQRNKSKPGIHDWTDEVIEEAQFRGIFGLGRRRLGVLRKYWVTDSAAAGR